MLIFRETNKTFKLDRDLLNTMTNYGFNVSHFNPQDQKQICESGRKVNFDIQQKRRKSPRDRSVTKLLKSPAGISTLFLSENPKKIVID